MKRAICLVFALWVATSVAAESKTRYLIGTRRNASLTAVGFLRDAGEAAARDLRTYTRVNVMAASLTATEAEELRRSGDVRYVDPVLPRYISAEDAPLKVAPDANPQTVPYGIDAIHARDVWRAGRGAGNVNVAIVDTGIDYNHPDLKDRYAGGYNVFKKTDDPKDDHGHGTHVAGTIAALDNTIGVVGVAPEVRIWSIKVLDERGSGTDETVIAGVNWLLAKKQEVGGNWIANFSLGAGIASNAEGETFRAAVADGVIIVAAAGNQASESINVPAAYQGVLAISAIDSTDKLADFSNYGRGIAFAAPGVRVLSTVPVGSVVVAGIRTSKQEAIEAVPLEGSSKGEIIGDTVFCGFGAPEDFPAEGMTGKIALIRRSSVPPGTVCSIPNSCFRDKVRNAEARGAAAVIILPDERGDRGWTLIADRTADANATFPLVVGLSALADVAKLIADAGKVKLTVSYQNDDYNYLSGTSMATPHVVGAVALAWSLAPTADAEQIKLALKLSAHDLGAPGYDMRFGYGRVDALAAAQYVAAGAFGVPPPTPPVSRRRFGH